jgi:HSP20 family protein
MPGVAKEDILVNVDRDTITLALSKTDESTDEEEREGVTFHRQERSTQFTSRSVRLPHSADMDHLEAAYENGVLRLTVPKREDAVAKRRSVPIK